MHARQKHSLPDQMSDVTAHLQPWPPVTLLSSSHMQHLLLPAPFLCLPSIFSAELLSVPLSLEILILCSPSVFFGVCVRDRETCTPSRPPTLLRAIISPFSCTETQNGDRGKHLPSLDPFHPPSPSQ